MKKGKLFLLPVPLGEQVISSIPTYVLEILKSLDVFIAERAKTARRYIKIACPEKALPPLQFYELNKHTSPEEITSFLDPIEQGQSIGLLSEAGCPGSSRSWGSYCCFGPSKRYRGSSTCRAVFSPTGFNGIRYEWTTVLLSRLPFGKNA